MNKNEALLALIAHAVFGRELDRKTISQFSARELLELFSIAKYHDVAHIAASGLDSIPEISKSEAFSSFSKERMLAVFRSRRLIDELSQISELFEKEKIDHIPLKGSVLRGYYPEVWMRTSCDIDILVKKEDLERARDLLIASLGYEYSAKTTHDISFDSPTGVHLELHFTLIEEGYAGADMAVLDKVWENTYLADGKSHTRFMTDGFFYYYHILHMAKHFVTGGCGVKSVLDLGVLQKRVDHSEEERAAFFAESDFSLFEKAVRRLCAVWFFGEERDELSRSLESFIFSGGVFGTVQNSVSIGVVKKGGRFKYAVKRIFLPYRSMKNIYPSLEKYKFLLPLYHVRRWCRVLFRGGAKKAKAEILKSKNVSESEIDATEKLLFELGLMKK